MVCSRNQPVYANPPFRGVKFVGAKGDGYTIEIAWHQAWPKPNNWEMVYNIYYSTIFEDVFDEGVKFVITDPERTTAGINGLTPGDIYYFAVRAAEFEPNTVQLSSLPESEGGHFYPEGVLRYNIGEDDILIPITDADQFPPIGIVQVGVELIGYSNVDQADGYLVSSLAQRGLYGTEARVHTTDGYDGYKYHTNPFVRHFNGFSDLNINIQFDENKFEHKYPNTSADGYKEKQNLVYTDSAATDEANSDLLTWDYSGYRRTHPLDLLSGKCVGSYYGGEFYCADGYDSVGNKIRGIPFEDQVNMREEVLIETTGELCALFIRQTSGKVSKHYDSSRENTAHRGLDTYGTDLVVGYEPFYNPKRSDGRIFVRFGPTGENIERLEEGLENVFVPDCWILSYPTIKDGDFIIRYNKYSGEEEWRYEILNVTRNVLIDGVTGAQKFTASRVRVTDPIAQVKANTVLGTLPEVINTSVGMVSGRIPPHVHTIRVNENITSISQINQVTSIAAGHNHEIVNGVIADHDDENNQLGHTHTIILP